MGIICKKGNRQIVRKATKHIPRFEFKEKKKGAALSKLLRWQRRGANSLDKY